jgi:heme-degrading monooxygenase HmoA
MSRLRVDQEFSDRLVMAFRNRLGAADAHEGFIDLEVWRSDRDSTEVLMISRWRDRTCFKNYMMSADHQRSHERISPEVNAAIQLERLEHMHTYEVVVD